jgi:hypothetical protein
MKISEAPWCSVVVDVIGVIVAPAVIGAKDISRFLQVHPGKVEE